MFVPITEPGIGPVAAKAFPNNRKPIQVRQFQGPVIVNSYWDGGSKDEFALVHLETLEKWNMPTSHPFFDRKQDGERMGNLELKELPLNTALVQGGTFCGKPATVTVLLREENMVKMLPQKQELTEEERAALDAIGGIKSSYRQEEFNRRGLGRYDISNPIIQSLVGYGLAKSNKAGSIQLTIEGKNARS